MEIGPNGGSEFVTGNPQVAAALRRMREKNDARFRDIEDAMVVQGHLEKQRSERLKEHAEFIRAEEQSQTRHKERMDEFDEKLNAVIAILDQLVRRPN
jgi:hypothetical protein